MSSNVIKNNDEVIADKGKALLKRITAKKNKKESEKAKTEEHHVRKQGKTTT